MSARFSGVVERYSGSSCNSSLVEQIRHALNEKWAMIHTHRMVRQDPATPCSGEARMGDEAVSATNTIGGTEGGVGSLSRTDLWGRDGSADTFKYN